MKPFSGLGKSLLVSNQLQEKGYWNTIRRESKPGTQTNEQMINLVFWGTRFFGYFFSNEKSNMIRSTPVVIFAPQ